jgi:hypothetical protein
MGRVINIPWVSCSIYRKWFDILWEVKILSVRGSIYHWYRVQNTMGRWSRFHLYGVDDQNAIVRGFDIPWVRGSKCYWYGIQYTMNKGFDMP